MEGLRCDGLFFLFENKLDNSLKMKSNEFDPKKYWGARAESYRATMESEYHRSRLAMIDALLKPNDFKGRVLDFGCGDGIHAVAAASAGATVMAIDIDQSMVDETGKRLESLGSGHQVVVGGVEKLAALPEKSCDTLLAFNVLAYLQDAQCDDFYREAARILKSGGIFLCTHSNELFDMFTFNKYTVAFFKKHFGVCGVEKLLAHPAKPDRQPLPTRENPLSFPHKLLRFGFAEQRQEFSIPHPMPPLLEEDFDPDDLASRKVSLANATASEGRWKLAFNCSIFGSRSVRV